MQVELCNIESRSEADAYLTALLAKPEYRLMTEIEVRAAKHINDNGSDIRGDFLNKASYMPS